jgi:hypothetical protein
VRRKDAIRRWVAKEMVGDNVTIEVTEVIEHHGQTIVRRRYDGEYDKTNLPDELILTNYFSVRDGKIDTLIVIRNTPVQEAGFGHGVPDVIRRYFELDADRDIDSIVGLFGVEGTVTDEGETRPGNPARSSAWTGRRPSGAARHATRFAPSPAHASRDVRACGIRVPERSMSQTGGLATDRGPSSAQLLGERVALAIAVCRTSPIGHEHPQHCDAARIHGSRSPQ